MEAVAQSWLVQKQTASPFLVELLAASEFIPVALLALSAGALADRHDRRKLVLAGQTAMMVLAAVLAVLAHLQHATPAVVIVLAFLEGAAWAAVMPAWQALVPALVPRDELPSAIALNSAQFNAARLVGPMIAGGLLTAAGAALVFDVNVVTSWASWWCSRSCASPPNPSATSRAGRESSSARAPSARLSPSPGTSAVPAASSSASSCSRFSPPPCRASSRSTRTSSST